MGIKDWLYSRRYKKAVNEQVAKDLYSSFLMDHGYSKETARAEADKRIMHHKGAAKIRKQKERDKRRKNK